MQRYSFILLFLTAFLLFSCAEYTPKPRGYFRIDPQVARYTELPINMLPYSFQISSLVTLELPLIGDTAGWINLSYPSWQAKIYCSYSPITPSTLDMAVEDSRKLLMRQSKGANTIKEQAFENPEQEVYASLYLLDGESPSPIQFTITDSVAHFFRGSLLYNVSINADSLAPVTQYIKTDILELIQSFSWKK